MIILVLKPIKCSLRPTHCFVYKQSKTGLFNYIVLHCIDFDDVNLTISPLDRPTPAEFTNGFSMMTSLINMLCKHLNNNHYFKNYSVSKYFT